MSATLNLLGIYHDTLIARQMADTKSKAVIPPTPHSKYIKAWMEKDWRYKWAARTLEIIRYVELVVEMGLRRKLGSKGVWRGILTLETMKYVLIDLVSSRPDDS